MDIFQRVVEVEGQLQYVNGALAADLENWERREYEDLAGFYQNQIVELNQAIEYYLENYGA
jgi:uncharacterized protein YfkK (UPF0435 family)